MTDTKLQAMLNYLTSLPQDKIQEVRIGWEQWGSDEGMSGTKIDYFPKLTVLFKD